MRPNAIRCQVCRIITLEAEFRDSFTEGSDPPPCPHRSDGGASEFVHVVVCREDECESPWRSSFAALHVEPVTS